jgi:hypothetical protein
MSAVIGAQFQMDHPHHVLHGLRGGLKVLRDGAIVVPVGHQFEDAILWLSVVRFDWDGRGREAPQKIG